MLHRTMRGEARYKDVAVASILGKLTKKKDSGKEDIRFIIRTNNQKFQYSRTASECGRQ